MEPSFRRLFMGTNKYSFAMWLALLFCACGSRRAFEFHDTCHHVRFLDRDVAIALVGCLELDLDEFALENIVAANFRDMHYRFRLYYFDAPNGSRRPFDDRDRQKISTDFEYDIGHDSEFVAGRVALLCWKCR